MNHTKISCILTGAVSPKIFVVYFFFAWSFLLCFVVTNSFADESHRDIIWEDLDHGLLKGREQLKVSLVYAQTKGCGPCSLIETKVFPQLQSIMEQLVLVKIDFNDRLTRIRIGDTVNSPFEWARSYNLYATPGFALIDSKGKNILNHVGLLYTKTLGFFLAYGSTGAYRHGSFNEYLRSNVNSNFSKFNEIHSQEFKPISGLASTNDGITR